MFKNFMFVPMFIASVLPGVFLVKALYGDVAEETDVQTTETIALKTAENAIVDGDNGTIASTTEEETPTKPAEKNTLQKSAKIVKTILTSPVTKSAPANENVITKREPSGETTISETQVAVVAPVVKIIKPTTAPYIFLDEFLSGWNLDSSSAMTDLKWNISENGSYGIKVIFSESSPEFRLKNNAGIDVGPYDGINFYIAGKSGNEKIILELYDKNGVKLGSQNIARYLYAGKITKKYEQVYINFIPLKARNSVISQIVFKGESSQEVYIDDLIFTGQLIFRPTNGLGDTYAPNIFVDEFINGWDIPEIGSDTRVYGKDGIDDTPSIQTTLRTAGQTLLFRQEQGMRTNAYQYFTFWAKGQALQDTIHVQFIDSLGTLLTSVTLGDYVPKAWENENFQKVSIPLKDLGAQNTVIKDVTFTALNDSRGFYLDNIRFEF